MSIGPLASLPAAAAGQPLAQAHGSEVERTGQEVAARQHRVAGEKKAEAAAGVGATDGEGEEAHERDADGRRLWEDQLDLSGDAQNGGQDPKASPEESPDAAAHSSNPGSTTGGSLDITA